MLAVRGAVAAAASSGFGAPVIAGFSPPLSPPLHVALRADPHNVAPSLSDEDDDDEEGDAFMVDAAGAAAAASSSSGSNSDTDSERRAQRAQSHLKYQL